MILVSFNPGFYISFKIASVVVLLYKLTSRLRGLIRGLLRGLPDNSESLRIKCRLNPSPVTRPNERRGTNLPFFISLDRTMFYTIFCKNSSSFMKLNINCVYLSWKNVYV